MTEHPSNDSEQPSTEQRDAESESVEASSLDASEEQVESCAPVPGKPYECTPSERGEICCAIAGSLTRIDPTGKSEHINSFYTNTALFCVDSFCSYYGAPGCIERTLSDGTIEQVQMGALIVLPDNNPGGWGSCTYGLH